MMWCAWWRKGILMWGGGSGEKWAKRLDGCLGLKKKVNCIISLFCSFVSSFPSLSSPVVVKYYWVGTALKSSIWFPWVGERERLEGKICIVDCSKPLWLLLSAYKIRILHIWELWWSRQKQLKYFEIFTPVAFFSSELGRCPHST